MTLDDMAESQRNPADSDAARQRELYTTVQGFADSLGISRQALHTWRQADGWPCDTEPPWTEDDRLAVLDAHAGQADGDSRDDVQRQWKLSQVQRNRASTLRILRESARELGQLVDAEAVKQVLRSSIGGGADRLACQQVWQRCGDAAATWAEAQGVKVTSYERGVLDDIMADAVLDVAPVRTAVMGALRRVAEEGFGDNAVADLARQVRELAEQTATELPAERRDRSDWIGEYVAQLREVMRTPRDEAAEAIEDLRVDRELAHAAIDADDRVARAVARMVADDDMADLKKRKGQ